MKELGEFFFRYRSYIPVPFVVVMLIFMKPTMQSIIAGLLLALSGELIRIWAVSYAGSETRTTSGVGGTYLITQGPYSIIRNPLYAGNILIYTGLGIMSMALFPYLQIFALMFFIFQYYCIILKEEEFLGMKFPMEFSKYFKSVGRFLPSIKALPEDIKSKVDFNLKSGIKSEKRSLQAIVIVASIIIIFYFLQKFVMN